MTVMDGPEISGYVERVRAALADLPPEVRDELTEDLPEHLAEVAAEADGSLVDRLGEPEAYANELRTAAGVGVPAAAPNMDRRIASAVVRTRARLRVADRRLGPILGYPRMSEFLRLLRPAWWLLRGYLVAMLITVATTSSFGLLPRLGGSSLAALLLLGVCLVGSVWLGRRTPDLSRWPRLAIGAGSGVLVIFALIGFADLDSNNFGDDVYYEPSSVQSPYIRDVFVYDREGRLVEQARLFDQDGNPIRLGYPDCPDPNGLVVEPKLAPPAYPYCPSAAPFRFQLEPPPPSGGPAPATATPAPATATPAEPATTPPAPATATPPAPGRPGATPTLDPPAIPPLPSATRTS